jgi:hypothetical protein
MSKDNAPFEPAVIAGNVPVLLISLEDQQERRQDLVKLGVPRAWAEHFWRATDFRGMRYEDIGQFADVAGLEAKLRRPLRPAEVGCALSHRAVCSWLSESEHSLALVLEDDIIPQSAEWLAEITAAAGALVGHADRGAAFICHLGPRHNQTEFALKRKVVWRNGSPPAGTPPLLLHCDRGRDLWRAHAYLISKAAAARSIKAETVVMTLADDWSERRKRGWIDEIFLAGSVIIGQDEERPSTIGYRSSAQSLSVNGGDPLLPGGRRIVLLLRGSRLYRSFRNRAATAKRRLRTLVPYPVSLGGRLSIR